MGLRYDPEEKMSVDLFQDGILDDNYPPQLVVPALPLCCVANTHEGGRLRLVCYRSSPWQDENLAGGGAKRKPRRSERCDLKVTTLNKPTMGMM